jgi:hypothetical protein
MFLFSSLVIIQFFFVGQGVSLSRGLCRFIPDVTVGIPHDAWCSPVGMLNVSQAGLELVVPEPTCFFCVIGMENLLWAEGLGCQSFDSSWCFFSANCGSSISASFFDLWSSCCLLLQSSCHLGSSLFFYFPTGTLGVFVPVVFSQRSWKSPCLLFSHRDFGTQKSRAS